MSSVEDTEVLMASYEDNTSQGKDQIFDSDSMIHVCSQKELFNSLVAKEEEIAKMVDGLTCEVIDSGTVQGYRKRWNGVCFRGGSVCPKGTL